MVSAAASKFSSYKGTYMYVYISNAFITATYLAGRHISYTLAVT